MHSRAADLWGFSLLIRLWGPYSFRPYSLSQLSFNTLTIFTQEMRLWVARQGEQEEMESSSSWEQPAPASYKPATLGSGCEVKLDFSSLSFSPSFYFFHSCWYKVYLSYHGLGPQHFFVSRADQAPALARLMEEVFDHHTLVKDDNVANDDVDNDNDQQWSSVKVLPGWWKRSDEDDDHEDAAADDFKEDGDVGEQVGARSQGGQLLPLSKPKAGTACLARSHNIAIMDLENLVKCPSSSHFHKAHIQSAYIHWANTHLAHIHWVSMYIHGAHFHPFPIHSIHMLASGSSTEISCKPCFHSFNHPNLIVPLSQSFFCSSVTLRVPPLAHAHHIIAWVTRPERPKGAKDKVKPTNSKLGHEGPLNF